MKILICGNMGYVGPVVVRHLRATWPDAVIDGYDLGLFAHCLSARSLPERHLDRQVFGDIRDIRAEDLEGYDAVIALAAISNDPMGDRYAEVTAAINQAATVRLARLASEAGARSFVFASSCSVYGTAAGAARTETDPLNPITAYARSKIGTEQELAGLATDMTVTCLRFATACGMSGRLRLDLVLNDFVACAMSSGEITVLSDGSPWRPLIDVADMARAIEWAIDRPAQTGGRFLAVNAGANEQNYQVRDLAQAVQAAVPGTRVSINTDAPADKRSYKVDFALFRSLAPHHQPQVSLGQSIAALHAGLQAIDFKDREFRTSGFIRLQVLEGQRKAGLLSADLRWMDEGAKTVAPVIVPAVRAA